MSGERILPLGIYLPGYAARTYTTSMLLSGVNEHNWVPFSSPENVLTSQVTMRMINMDLLHHWHGLAKKWGTKSASKSLNPTVTFKISSLLSPSGNYYLKRFIIP